MSTTWVLSIMALFITISIKDIQHKSIKTLSIKTLSTESFSIKKLGIKISNLKKIITCVTTLSSGFNC